MVNGISISKPDRLIVWIRNDIRVHDNLALWSATQDASMVIPLFIIDGEFLSLSPYKRHIILNALAGLRDDLKRIGGVLVIRTGEPASVLLRMVRESGSAGVYVTGSNEPARVHSDEQIRSDMDSAGKVWRMFPHNVIFGAGDILTSSGTPFKVFTPYRKAWLARRDDIAPPLPSPLEVQSPRIDPGLLPGLSTSELPGGARPPAGNEKAGLAALKTFFPNGVAGYRKNRDVPGADGTSRLSHHLAIGSIGVRTVYKAIRDVHRGSGEGAMSGAESLEDVDSFLSQVIWRDFYKQILSNYPHVDGKSFKTDYDAIPWKTNVGHFNAWRDGFTGYPIVDAAMRQLKAEGWMHNRGRMIVSGFLTKDLHIDWRMGERHFMEWLADGDLALNNGGWQWSAGTGTDAQPWYRIFNPVLQGEKFDPKGEYVKKYIPELSGVPARFIHTPWTMPESVQREAGVIIGKGYPAPIVDHAEERKHALRKYRPGRVSGPVRNTPKVAEGNYS